MAKVITPSATVIRSGVHTMSMMSSHMYANIEVIAVMA